ncbi:allantoicase [Nocardioides sp. GY 10113]|uniref:allantoicase n=1 Tax=Nocardioides sp. GY 10113 TaxID=2569761 RepID=UPI0010A78DDB|nr:allantoicase [Nocardioides sp. GY 10113]TIC89137.1 allantoicase [Nocardioides sp. GY 10113]
MTDFRNLPDLAARALGGAVVHANDELFAEKENLIKPGPAQRSDDFGHKGKVYDGWETRRRRTPGSDHAIVRLAVPGRVHGVVVDTAYFAGNYPPYVSVEGAVVDGYPDPEAIVGWFPLLEKVAVKGDCENAFGLSDEAAGRRITHVRLTIYPDGGVARFRVHGVAEPDPALLTGTIDLAALENGGVVTGCSDAFYGSATQLLLPGRARSMGDGWENARRRDDGNDFVEVRLAGRGVVRRLELDTSYFVGNAPGWASVTGRGPDGDVDLLPRTRLQPDTRHVFVVEGTAGAATPVESVRLDVFPDGGMARLRVWGELVAAG